MDVRAPSRAALLGKARAQRAGKEWDAMCLTMKQVLRLAREGGQNNLHGDEPGLFSIAYKRAAEARRQQMFDLEASDTPSDEKQQEVCSAELEQICSEMVSIIDGQLLPSCVSDEYRVFYLKEKGDFLRYLAEISADKDIAAAVGKAEACYRQATELASVKLSVVHHVRLALAINYGVLLHDLKRSPIDAWRVVKQALEESAVLKFVVEDGKSLNYSLRKSLLARKSLECNAALWSSETTL